MKRHEEGGWVLTPDEVDGLAMRLTLDNLCDWEPEWEDVPRLSEASWFQVVNACEDYVRKLRRDLRRWESMHELDMGFIVEELEA